jgi:hypothetical protein
MQICLKSASHLQSDLRRSKDRSDSKEMADSKPPGGAEVNPSWDVLYQLLY